MSNEIVVSQWFDVEVDSPVRPGSYEVMRQNGEVGKMVFDLRWPIPVAFLKSWRGVVRGE